MITLKDVAKLANVDVSTVSRCLNNKSYIHPETRAKIMAAVEELSYRPNVLAKSLREGKRNTIAVVIPKLSFSIFAEVASGIEQEAIRRGYATIICNTGDTKEEEKKCLNRLRNGFIDGLIVAGCGANKRLIREINSDEMPVVQVIRELDPLISSIVVDYADIGYRSVKYLYERGCRKIGLINGSMDIPPYAERYKGYKRAISELHLEEIAIDLDSNNRGMKYGYDCTNRLIDGYSHMDAIMAGTDAQGMGVLRAAKENGLSVPQDLQILSMTGYQVGDMLETSLTSMELPGYEIGNRATEMLIHMIEADKNKKIPVQHLRFDATLNERESTSSV